MTKRIILHIGAGKTGTTTVQDFLWKNIDALQKQGYFFAKFLGPDSQIWLPFLAFEENNPRVLYSLPFLSENADIQNEATREKGKADKVNFLKNWLRCLPEHSKVIFSCEWLFDLKINEIERFRALFDADFDIEIIVYLREPVSHLLSAWSQHVCNGFSEQMTSPVDFLIGSHKELFDYRTHIENWEKLFPGRVKIRRLDSRFLAGNDLLLDFSNACDISWNESFYRPAVLNKSISWEAQKLLSAINLIFPAIWGDGTFNKNRGNLTELLSGIGDANSKYIPTHEELGALNDYFSDFNAWLSSHYFPNDDILWATNIEARRDTHDRYYSVELSKFEIFSAELIVKILDAKARNTSPPPDSRFS